METQLGHQGYDHHHGRATLALVTRVPPLQRDTVSPRHLGLRDGEGENHCNGRRENYGRGDQHMRPFDM